MIIIFILNILFLILMNKLKPNKFIMLTKYKPIYFRLKEYKDEQYILQVKVGLFWCSIYKSYNGNFFWICPDDILLKVIDNRIWFDYHMYLTKSNNLYQTDIFMIKEYMYKKLKIN